MTSKTDRKLNDEEGLPQLTIDGGEVSSERANRTSSAGANPSLTESQRLIVEKIRRDGSIRSVEAGVILHACRSRPCGRIAGAGSYSGPPTASRIGCCGFAAADGLEAMKRLAERGLVERSDVGGIWHAAQEGLSER